MRFRNLPHRQAAKARASLRTFAVSPEPLRMAYKKSEHRQKLQPKVRFVAPLISCSGACLKSDCAISSKIGSIGRIDK